MSRQQLPHLIVEGFFNTEKYTAAPRPGPAFSLPARERTEHGASVREQLQRVRGENEQSRGVQTEPGNPSIITLEVRSEPGFLLKLESLEDRRKGIEVTCVKQDGPVQVATVHVPEGALTHFLKRAEEYLSEDTRKGNPQHQPLVASISQIRLATLHTFWTDDEAGFPPPDQAIWWEVWVRTIGDQSPWDSFSMLARSNGLTLGSDTIRFPDRLVGLAHGTANQLMASAELLDMIGEVRRAKENPADFIDLEPKEQAEWVNSLLPRITAPPLTAPAVCLLDSGVMANPLILPALDPVDIHRYDPNWPITDATNSFQPRTHGTKMAGVLLFGSRLADYLAGNDSIALTHRLESVRILPPRPHENEPRLFGAITSQAISRVEIARPERTRSFCMPLTTDGNDIGRPSSWSGVIDQLCAGITDENPRLFLISAGNTDPNQRHRYPDSNDTDNVKDPAQAWNAVTVGACTDCVQFDQAQFPGCVPIASAGDLSPSSTTSLSWERTWPYKPDIVMEGGNQIVVPGTDTVWDPEDMTMLTTAHAAAGRLLVEFRDTSAATAQAARIAAILQAEYPKLWPETIRALLIHSAEWTERL